MASPEPKRIGVKKPYLLASVSAFACAIILLTCIWIILLFAPSFWHSLDDKVRIISTHPELIKVWYFFIWIVYGVFVGLFSFAIISSRSQKENLLTFVVVASFVDVFYAFAIGGMSIFSSHPEVIAGGSPDAIHNGNLHFIFHVLWQLRLSTEPFSESWILLFNVWLLRRTHIHKTIPIAGIAMVCYLHILLLSNFTLWRFELSMLYIHIKCVWFMIVGTWLWKQHQNKRPPEGGL